MREPKEAGCNLKCAHVKGTSFAPLKVRTEEDDEDNNAIAREGEGADVSTNSRRCNKVSARGRNVAMYQTTRGPSGAKKIVQELGFGLDTVLFVERSTVLNKIIFRVHIIQDSSPFN